MKSIKLALMAGAAIAVSAAAAHADDLDTLKAQIETLNARVAAMEAAPAVPAGYNLIAVSEGSAANVPGLAMSAQDKMLYGNKATVISVLPTADAPAGTTITWSGFTRAAVVYQDSSEASAKLYNRSEDSADWEKTGAKSADPEADWDVKAGGEITVVGTPDTAVGEVGVKVSVRGDFNGNGASDVSMPTAWGYWAMTPELTLGGGYAGSLGNIGYGQDSGSYMYTEGVNFDPGDTTQMRLSYASGPFSAAIAVEDASTNGDDVVGKASANQLGVGGEIKYSGDSMSGEISGVWRSLDDDAWEGTQFGTDASWQIGTGVGFGLGEMASLSFAAAMGEGPATAVDADGNNTNNYPWNASWWGASALASVSISDEVHVEASVGYKDWTFDDVTFGDFDYSADYSLMVVGAGVYYTPVDQLTIGLEASYSEKVGTAIADDKHVDDTDYKAKLENDTVTLDLVSVWRF